MIDQRHAILNLVDLCDGQLRCRQGIYRCIEQTVDHQLCIAVGDPVPAGAVAVRCAAQGATVGSCDRFVQFVDGIGGIAGLQFLDGLCEKVAERILISCSSYFVCQQGRNEVAGIDDLDFRKALRGGRDDLKRDGRSRPDKIAHGQRYAIGSLDLCCQTWSGCRVSYKCRCASSWCGGNGPGIAQLVQLGIM